MSAPADQPLSQLLNAVRGGQDQQTAATERKARRQRLDERFCAAYRDVIDCLPQLLSPKQNPPEEGYWARLAERMRALGEALNEADREHQRFRIRERLGRASRVGVPALETAAQLLLSAPEAAAAKLAETLQAVQSDGRRDVWVAWLPYIVDQLMNSHRPPGKLPPLPGTTRDDWRKADLAFGCILFSDDSFRFMQSNIDQAAAQLDAALKAGGHPVLGQPAARVRDMIRMTDPRALHWYGSEQPAPQLLQPPPSIEAITHPEETRRVLDEVWTAANLLQMALDKWVEWFSELQEKGDAHPAIALNCEDMARRAIKVLVVNRPRVAPFDGADEATLKAMLPPVPGWWMPGTHVDLDTAVGQRIERPRIRWQEDREFLDRYYSHPERLHEEATKLRGAAAQLVELLKTFPESVMKAPRPGIDERNRSDSRTLAEKPACNSLGRISEESEAAAAPTPTDRRAKWKELWEVIALLKRVTPEWPHMGIDWPLVLCTAEKMFFGNPEGDPAAAGRPAEGQELSDFLRGVFDIEAVQQADPIFRCSAYAAVLLNAFAVLEAFCKASLAIGYDLDAIERPVKKLPPFHALMVLGWPVAELIRCVRDLSKTDLEVMTAPASQPVKVGAAYGRNAHHATWKLADEICRLCDSVTEGHLAVWRMAEQEEGAREYAWVELSRALDGRFPPAIEAKHVRALLEIETMAEVNKTPPPPPQTVHNDDFTMVIWYGTEHSFALGVQSSAVRALWEEWEKSGLGLHQETIREKVDAERNSFRMDTAFRGHPAFGTMIQRHGDGRYLLARPDSQATLPAKKAKRTAKNAPKSRQKRA